MSIQLPYLLTLFFPLISLFLWSLLVSLVIPVTVTHCRSYTKPKGQLPDYEAPVVLREGHSSAEDFCNRLHRTIINEFK